MSLEMHQLTANFPEAFIVVKFKFDLILILHINKRTQKYKILVPNLKHDTIECRVKMQAKRHVPAKTVE